MLRAFVIGFGLLLLGFSAYLYRSGSGAAMVPLAMDGLFIVGAIVFERSRYRPKVDRNRGNWEDTGERFVDPTTGKTMIVRFNPDTGQRDYMELR